jgi:hypothetical protein
MLLRLLTPRFDVCQRRPDKFAIHNASSKMNRKKKNANPDFNSAVQSEIASRRLRPSEERYALTR